MWLYFTVDSRGLLKCYVTVQPFTKNISLFRSVNNKGQITGRGMQLILFIFTCVGQIFMRIHVFTLHFSVKTNESFLKICALGTTNIQNNQNGECWCWCMIILMLHNLTFTCLYSVYVAFVKTFLTLQFNRRNTVYFKTMAHCVCCVWVSLEWVLGE